MHESGLAGMRRLISETALWGELKVGPAIIDSQVKKKMAAALRRIRSGGFARELLNETRAGGGTLNKCGARRMRVLSSKSGSGCAIEWLGKKAAKKKNIPEPACSRFRHFANFVAMPSPLVVGDPRITDHQHRDRGRRNPAKPFDRLRNSRSGRLYIVNDPPRLLDYLILSLRDVFIVAVSECGDAERKAQHGSNAQQAGKPEGCFHIASFAPRFGFMQFDFCDENQTKPAIAPKGNVPDATERDAPWLRRSGHPRRPRAFDK